MASKKNIQSAKRVQCLPRNTSSAAIFAPIGWSYIEHHVDRQKLLFVGSIMRLGDGMLCKRLFLYRYDSCVNTSRVKQNGLVNNYVEILEKYELKEIFQEWRDSNRYFSKQGWKKLVNTRIREKDKERWQTELNECVGHL